MLEMGSKTFQVVREKTPKYERVPEVKVGSEPPAGPSAKSVYRLDSPDLAFLLAAVSSMIILGAYSLLTFQYFGTAHAAFNLVITEFCAVVVTLATLSTGNRLRHFKAALLGVSLAWVTGIVSCASDGGGYLGSVLFLDPFEYPEAVFGYVSLVLWLGIVILAARGKLKGPRARGSIVFLIATSFYFGLSNLGACYSCTGGGSFFASIAFSVAWYLLLFGQLVKRTEGVLVTCLGILFTLTSASGIGLILTGHFLAARTAFSRTYWLFAALYPVGVLLQVYLMLRLYP
jgi:hypothetical protein